ncbi:DUF882 domain-containing protein [Hydrogenimonas sp.]
MKRREFIKKSVAGALALTAFPNIVPASTKAGAEKRLSLYNIHTGEMVRATFWADGEYVAEELAALNHLLRDFRTGEVQNMDPRLFDLLHRLQHTFARNDRPYHVISGYRSPKTNAMLRKRSHGVAKRSLHMQGRAIDINLPGTDLEHLRLAALSLRRGGVGYYPVSGFIHVDTGRVRQWSGR